MVTSLFGMRDYAEIYSTSSLGLALAAIVALPAYGFIYDAVGSDVPALYVILGMLALKIPIVLAAFASQKKLVEAGHWLAEGADTEKVQ